MGEGTYGLLRDNSSSGRRWEVVYLRGLHVWLRVSVVGGSDHFVVRFRYVGLVVGRGRVSNLTAKGIASRR